MIQEVEEMMPGHVVRDGFRHTVRAVCGDRAIPVASGGSKFYMVGFFPWRLVAAHLGEPLTRQNIGEWIDGAKHGKPRIQIAHCPDVVPRSLMRALTGGGYHESFHRVYTCQTRPTFEAIVAALGPYMALADWSKYRKVVLDMQNVIEDVLIERVGNADFPGAYQKMCDLQDFILNMEAPGRAQMVKAASEGKEIRIANVAMSMFRDLGLGYPTGAQDAAMVEYRTACPDACDLVEAGELRPLLNKCIPAVRTQAEIKAATELIESGFSLLAAMDFVLILLGKKALQEEVNPPSPQPGQPGEEGEGSEGEGSEGGSPSPGKGKSGKGKKSPKGESEGESEGEGDGEPSSGGSGGKPGEKKGSKVGSKGGGSKGEESEDKGSGGSDPTGESEEGGDPSDGEGDDEAGESEGSPSQGQTSKPGGKTGGRGLSDPTKTLAAILADAMANGLGLKDLNSALNEAVKEANKEASKGTRPGEKPYRPMTTDYDGISLVRGSGSALPTGMASVADEARQASATVRAQTRNLFFGLETGGREHGLPRGPIFSERNLVDTVACIRGGSNPNRAFAEDDVAVDLSLACVTIVDQSGSMSDKLVSTGGVLYAIALAMEGIGAHQMIAGFRNGTRTVDTEGTDPTGTHRQGSIHYDVFLRWGERFSANVARLANLTASGGTPMADGMELGLRELRRRKETNRVLFMVTDGQPDPTHHPVVVGQIRQATEEGIMVIGVGLGKDSLAVTRLFPHHVHRNRISEIPVPTIALLRVLVRTIRAKSRLPR